MSSNNKINSKADSALPASLSSLAFTQFIERISLSVGELNRDSFAVFVCDGSDFIESKDSSLLNNLHFSTEGSIIPKNELSGNQIYVTSALGLVDKLESLGIQRDANSIVVLDSETIHKDVPRDNKEHFKTLRLK